MCEKLKDNVEIWCLRGVPQAHISYNRLRDGTESINFHDFSTACIFLGIFFIPYELEKCFETHWMTLFGDIFDVNIRYYNNLEDEW